MLISPEFRFRVPSAAAAAVRLALLAAVLWGPLSTACRAEEIQDSGVDEVVSPEPSRDAWRARVQEAKRRAREIAVERRLHPELTAPPPPEDPAVEASRRVLNDDSLQHGDIVATDKGLFVFRGRIDQPRRDDDFVALPRR